MTTATPPTPPMADLNLLVGILALQMDFISRDALIAAMNAWVLDKAKPLGQILLQQGALTADTQALLEALVQKHLQLHDNAPHKSLLSVSSLDAPLRQQLEQLGDPDLCPSLALLLASSAAAPDFDAALTPLTSPPATARPLSGSAPTAREQRFRILRPHAKGGLGAVFVAYDEELHREVALKEIQNRYVGHQESRARFLLEAEITGGLEHPGIVPVYGLGRYADGRPYYAMRLVKGQSLREAIQHFHEAEGAGRDAGERTLALRQLLGRFVAVCNALAYAHSRGVVHRDVKPDNILLGPFGETLVVDWGLAKVVGRGPEETHDAEATLRPPSAESLDPTRVGAHYGTPAYMSPEQAEGHADRVGPASDIYSLGATLYTLLVGRPPIEGSDLHAVLGKARAGDWLPPRQRDRTIPASLDAVCRKAMARKPEERYPTALALAADIEHWLADEPVSAYREPRMARVGRWMRRHKPLTAAVAAMVLAVLLLGSGGAWWLTRQQARQRRGVETALAEVAQLQQQARWAEARAVLEQTESRLGEIGSQHLRGRLEQARRELELVARLDAIRLNRVTLVEGQFDTAMADREYAVAFREAGLGEVGEDPAAVAARVVNSAVIGVLVATLDDWADCATGARRNWVLEVARKADPDPWRDRVRDPAVWRDADALTRLAGEERAAVQSPQLLAAVGMNLTRLGGNAEPLLRAAQERHPSDFWVNFTLGNVLSKDKPGEAVGYYRAALALRPGTSAVYNNLGNALSDLHRLDEAVVAYQKAIALDPNYAYPHNGLGSALYDLHRLEEAVAEYQKAIALDPKYAVAHNGLGNALYDLHRLDEAVAECKKAIELDPKYALAHNNLGNALYDRRRLNEAVAEYQQAIKLDPKDARPHSNLGSVLLDLGRLDEAALEYQKAIALDPRSAPPHNGLGIALRDLHRPEEAIAEFQKAIALDPNFAYAHNNLGNALYDLHRLDEAVVEFRKAIELNPKYASPHNGLGSALRDLDRLDEAVAEYQKAIKLDPNYANAYRNLADTLLQQGQFAKARQAAQRYLELAPDSHPQHEAALGLLRQCEQMIALEPKLAAIEKGEAKPADADEQMGLAQLCLLKKRYAAAARFSADAFAARPKLAEDLQASHRYDAACYAALAAAGQGQDAAKLDDKERARLRRQALDWLRADLALWAHQVEDGKAEARARARQTLQHWQEDADLAGLHDAAALAKLPSSERATCQKLWADVAALVKKCGAKGQP